MLCIITSLYGITLEQSKNIIKEWLIESMIKTADNSPDYYDDISEVIINKNKYIFIQSEVQSFDESANIIRNMCFGIFYKDILDKCFCLNGYGSGNIVSNGNFFTISFYKDDYRFEVVHTIYITFKLIKDKFYLHQYSKEKFKKSEVPKTNDDFILDKTIICYRQPRDDAKSKNLIPLDSINDELLERLQDECEKSGKCK